MNSIKKIFQKVFFLFILTSFLLEANQYDYPFNSYEQETGNCYWNSCCYPSSQLFVRGDLLYWTPRVTGLELNFGSTEIVEEVVDCTQIFTAKEVDLDPHFKWNVGYRLGLGYEANKWQLEALWTHFQGSGKRTNHNELPINSSGKIKIKLDQIDLLLGYNYNISCPVLLKPFIGVRGARIHEHLKALLVTEISTASNSSLETKTFDDRQKYWGIGPLFGVEGNWSMNRGFGLYGTVAASLLYGNYNVQFEDSDTYTSSLSKEIFNSNKRHVHAFDFNIDLALGVSWNVCIGNQSELIMKLGFEQHQYFNQNRLCVSRGDTSFTGGVFSLEIGF